MGERKDLRYQIFWFSLWLITFILFCISMHRNTQYLYINKTIYLDTCLSKPIIKIDTMTKETVYQEILDNNIQFPQVVLAQSIVETGYFSSKVCREYNNLFGFFDGQKYLKFDNWRESVKYYAAWQKKNYTGGSYFKFLEELPYAQDSNYVELIKKVKI